MTPRETIGERLKGSIKRMHWLSQAQRDSLLESETEASLAELEKQPERREPEEEFLIPDTIADDSRRAWRRGAASARDAGKN